MILGTYRATVGVVETNNMDLSTAKSKRDVTAGKVFALQFVVCNEPE